MHMVLHVDQIRQRESNGVGALDSKLLLLSSILKHNGGEISKLK